MSNMLRRLFEKLLSAFLLLGVIRRLKSRSSLMKIKAAQVYVLGVKKTRIFFIGILLVFISFVFLMNGLTLVQTAFFTYSMWNNETKFVMALILGCFEFLLAAGIFIYLFKESTWSNFFGVQRVVNSVIPIEDKNKDQRTQA